MRKLLILSFLLSSLVSFSQLQYGVRQKISGKGMEWKEGQFDSLFKLPKDTFRIRDIDSNALAFRKGCLYIHTSGAWRKFMCYEGPSTPVEPDLYAFTVNPSPQTVTASAPFSLSATFVGGTAPFTWEWYTLESIYPSGTEVTALRSNTHYKGGGILTDKNFYAKVTDNLGQSIYSDTVLIAVMDGAQITYGYSASDPYVDNSTAPTVSNPAVISIAHNADLNLFYPAAAVDKFLIVKVPSGESVKNLWFVEAANNGSIPDPAWRAPFTVGGFTYYVTRNEAGFTFNYTLPVQLKN